MKVLSNQERLNQLFDSDSRSDTAIADSLNVSKQTISSWRNGSRSPKKTTLMKIAEMYNVDIAWLMGYEDEEQSGNIQPKNDDVRLILRGLNKLSPEQIEQSKAMFKVMFAPQYNELFTKENEDDT